MHIVNIIQAIIFVYTLRSLQKLPIYEYIQVKYFWRSPLITIYIPNFKGSYVSSRNKMLQIRIHRNPEKTNYILTSCSYFVYDSSGSSYEILYICCGICVIRVWLTLNAETKKKKLNIYNLNGITVNCRRTWTPQLLRMNNTRFPQVMYE